MGNFILRWVHFLQILFVFFILFGPKALRTRIFSFRFKERVLAIKLQALARLERAEESAAAVLWRLDTVL